MGGVGWGWVGGCLSTKLFKSSIEKFEIFFNFNLNCFHSLTHSLTLVMKTVEDC